MVLSRVTADEVIRPVSSGRTRPILMLCGVDSETPIELFCKLSSGCDEGVNNLAREVIAACLATDIGLPTPVPYLVEIPPELANVIADPNTSGRIRTSSSVGFGSAKVHNQFNAWMIGSRISDVMVPAALSTFVFDAVIENVDRRPSNPNCLVSGDRFRLIDHEMAFPPSARIIGWRPPWQVGALSWMDQPDGHIFCKGLKKRDLDFSSLPRVWSQVSDARLLEYRAAIPPEWSPALRSVDEALNRVRNARDNIHGVITEIERVLR